jgi:two-component system response regulator AtoC
LGFDIRKSTHTFQSDGGPAIFPPLPETGINLNEIELSMERYYIEAAYEMANGNESKAANLLGINHHTYRYRRKKLHEK